MRNRKSVNYNFLKNCGITLPLFLILTFGSLQSKAQGWQYNFAGKSLAQLVEEGFVHENFNAASDGIVTNNLANFVATIRTPYFYLGVDDYFTFNGARLNNAAGNGTLNIEIFAEALDGTILKSTEYFMHDASQEEIPEFDFSVLAKGFYRIGIRISYTGNNRTHMIRVPDDGRFELRLMDGSSNPYLLQGGIIAAGLHGLNNKIDPGEPMSCNMYTDYKNYPNLKKLPNEIGDALDFLQNSRELKEAFGEDTINSYIKLKRLEIENFNQEEIFNKKYPVTQWEKNNTLDC